MALGIVKPKIWAPLFAFSWFISYIYFLFYKKLQLPNFASQAILLQSSSRSSFKIASEFVVESGNNPIHMYIITPWANLLVNS